VPFLDQARRDGAQTLVVGPPGLARLAAETGHPFLPGDEPPEELVRPIREQLPVLPASEASVLGELELFGRLATTAMLPAMAQAVLDWRPDVILRDPCEYASAVVAARQGMRIATVAISLARAEWGASETAEPALEAHRDGLADELRRSPYLTRFPAALDPSPFSATRRYRDPSDATHGALPAWWADASAPLVYVTFGTVLGYMSFAGEVYRTVLDAVAGLDARVLLTTGHAFDASGLPDVPANVHVEAWVDQADVLREAALVVCHGGSGTVYGTLAAGVPLVAVPVFADQFANAANLAQAGAGLQVRARQDATDRRHPVGRDDAPRIRQAIEAVLFDGSYREAAAAIAADMAAAPAIGTLLEELLSQRR
jgi:UDP:flavonoid glycosyltransferase YjiC (YdhE family)